MTTQLSSTAQDTLKNEIERIEKLAEEKAELQEGIKEIMKNLKNEGFDTKVVRQVIKLRKIDKAKREEAEEIQDLYMHAIGEI